MIDPEDLEVEPEIPDVEPEHDTPAPAASPLTRDDIATVIREVVQEYAPQPQVPYETEPTGWDPERTSLIASGIRDDLVDEVDDYEEHLSLEERREIKSKLRAISNPDILAQYKTNGAVKSLVHMKIGERVAKGEYEPKPKPHVQAPRTPSAYSEPPTTGGISPDIAAKCKELGIDQSKLTPGQLEMIKNAV